MTLHITFNSKSIYYFIVLQVTRNEYMDMMCIVYMVARI